MLHPFFYARGYHDLLVYAQWLWVTVDLADCLRLRSNTVDEPAQVRG